MFSAPKLAKTTPLVAPSHSVSNLSMNSSKKYFSALNNSRVDLCNQSFDTAQALFQRATNAGNVRNFRQTLLGIRKCNDGDGDVENQQPSSSKKPDMHKTEFFLLPLPEKVKKPQTDPSEKSTPLDLTINPMKVNGRDAVVLMGKVEFCLKMHKLYTNINALWSVYGKLIKIIEGKIRGEHILLLRNMSGDGPVLQSTFYDFGGIIDQIQIGTNLRIVGRFLSVNRFHVYKLEKTNFEKPAEEEFSRIQNVISFVLLQNHANETTDK